MEPANQASPADEPSTPALEPVALAQQGSTALLSSFPLSSVQPQMASIAVLTLFLVIDQLSLTRSDGD